MVHTERIIWEHPTCCILVICRAYILYTIQAYFLSTAILEYSICLHHPLCIWKIDWIVRRDHNWIGPAFSFRWIFRYLLSPGGYWIFAYSEKNRPVRFHLAWSSSNNGGLKATAIESSAHTSQAVRSCVNSLTDEWNTYIRCYNVSTACSMWLPIKGTTEVECNN